VPELPEVERARALIERRALHRRIRAVDDRDTYVTRPHAPGEIAAALEGTELTAAHRRGKSIWIETDGGPVLGLHLGMTGRIVVDDESEGDRLRPARRPRPGPPPHWDRFALEFEDGGRLALRDQRRLGRAVLQPDIDRLGPDAAEVDRRSFRERVGRGRSPIKARVIDQSVIAGVGNLLADEALWEARIDPRRPAGELSEAELDRLRRAVRAATRSAIRRGGAHTGRLIAERHPGGRCPRDGTPLERGRVGGRTTFWCPREQR
jgi:formamidopyrimidine-DNA glycosylase